MDFCRWFGLWLGLGLVEMDLGLHGVRLNTKKEKSRVRIWGKNWAFRISNLRGLKILFREISVSGNGDLGNGMD